MLPDAATLKGKQSMPFCPSQGATDQLALGTASEIGRRMAQDGGGSVALTKHLLDQIETQVTPVFLAVTRARALAEDRKSVV